jgi:hypothetical protein
MGSVVLLLMIEQETHYRLFKLDRLFRHKRSDLGMLLTQISLALRVNQIVSTVADTQRGSEF